MYKNQKLDNQSLKESINHNLLNTQNLISNLELSVAGKSSAV